jgi:hypothetical protein
MSQHFLQSRYREKLIEHLFVGELLRHSWRNHGCSLEIARPEVDNGGYDLVDEEHDVLRHIQLKAARLGAKVATQKVHVGLGNKPSGCVVWIFFDEETLSLGPFLFFGGRAGEPIPDLSELKVAKHTKGNAAGVKAERPNIREVPRRRFQKYDSVEEIYGVLFSRA